MESEEKPYLGFIASEQCKESLEDHPREWRCHLRDFIKRFSNLLEKYKVIATGGTAKVMKGIQAEEGVPLDIEPLESGFRGVVSLAARVAKYAKDEKKKIDRVLFFQDPEDLKTERPENHALLRNCNLHGKKLCFNNAALLWAAYESDDSSLMKSLAAEDATHSKGDIKQTVVFIAHDNEKQRMARFVLHYRDVLCRFSKLTATSGTKRYIDEFLKERISPHRRLKIESAGALDKDSHGPSGGDVIVADEIFSLTNKSYDFPIYHVLFFIDHNRNHPHEADIQVLLRTCVDPRLPVNLILNSRMAEEWGERYRRFFERK